MNALEDSLSTFGRRAGGDADEEGEAGEASVFDSVGNSGFGPDDGARTCVEAIGADLEEAGAFVDEVELVTSGVIVDCLHLTGLQAIDPQEEVVPLKQRGFPGFSVAPAQRIFEPRNHRHGMLLARFSTVRKSLREIKLPQSANSRKVPAEAGC